MATRKYIEAVIAVILLIVLVFIAQLVTGVFGTATSQINSTVAGATMAAVMQTPTISSNALTTNGANTLTLTLGGAFGWISTSTPITVSVTGNSVSTYSTNNLNTKATPGPLQTQTFTVTNGLSATNTLTTTTGNFYNITSISLGFGGLGYKASPSITASVQESFWQANTLTTGTVTGNVIYTAPQSQAVTQYVAVGSATGTIIPFITVIIIVSLVVILLDLFGVNLGAYFKRSAGE
jgi:hypothetical protein